MKSAPGDAGERSCQGAQDGNCCRFRKVREALGEGQWKEVREGGTHLMGCVRRAVFRASTTWFLISISSSSNLYRLCI